MLLLAYIDWQVQRMLCFADYHAFIYFYAWSEKQNTPFFSVFQAEIGGYAGFPGNNRTRVSAGQVACQRMIPVEHGMHHAHSVRGGQELVTETEQTTGGDNIGQMDGCVRVVDQVDQLTFTLAQHFHHHTHAITPA